MSSPDCEVAIKSSISRRHGQALLAHRGLGNLYDQAMELKDWVKAARTHAGLTIEQLGAKLGRSKAAAGFWEKGGTKPSFEQVQRIAEVTGYGMPGDLPTLSSEQALAPKLTLSTDRPDDKGDPQSATVHPYSNTGDRDRLTTNVAAAPALRPSSRVPVVGQVRAGKDGYLEESPYDGEVEYWTGDQGAFALRVNGDSMHPRYRAGEFVIVSPNVVPLPGGDVVISLKCGRKLLKQLNWIRGDELQLLSINGDYGPETILLSEVMTIQKVLGSVGADALLKSR